jgi:hypothetical protein
MKVSSLGLAVALICALTFTANNAHAADPLPSWNDGKAKESFIAFVEKVTKPDTEPPLNRVNGRRELLRPTGTL